MWDVMEYTQILGLYPRYIPIILSVSVVVKRLYELGRGQFADGYFNDLAWGDVFAFGGSQFSVGDDTYWFVGGDHLHPEKWILRQHISSWTTGAMTFPKINSWVAFPLDFYDCPKDYYSYLLGVYVLSGDYRRFYGLPDSRAVEAVIFSDSGGRFVDYWHTASDAFTKTYDRRMKRVEADMKVILWKSLRHLRVRGYCFPWDCCELIVSFLAVTPITGGYTLCVLK